MELCVTLSKVVTQPVSRAKGEKKAEKRVGIRDFGVQNRNGSFFPLGDSLEKLEQLTALVARSESSLEQPLRAFSAGKFEKALRPGWSDCEQL